MAVFPGFDRERAARVARWLSEQKGERVSFQRVEPGDEQILEPRAQRELDAVDSLLERR